MSVWTTKSSGRDRDYILIKHPLRGVNYIVKGIKFRESYAVVERNSKTYNELLKMPLLRKCEEFDLLFLRKLKFITRSSDVRMVYGEDVYRFYIRKLEAELSKEAVVEQQVQEEIHLAGELCKHRTQQDLLCKFPAIEVSPGGFCRHHILDDPKLAELGIAVPKFIPKKERAEVKDRIIKQLEKMK